MVDAFNRNIRVIPEKMVAFLMPDAFTDDSVKAFCRRQHVSTVFGSWQFIVISMLALLSSLICLLTTQQAFRSRFMRSHQSLRDEIKQLHTCVKGSTPPNKPLIEPLQAQFECSPHNIQNVCDDGQSVQVAASELALCCSVGRMLTVVM